MAVFRVERNTGYTVMSNHHLRNKELSLKAKGLLSQMLSLPEDWDYTLAGLSHINREKIDAIREAVKELEKAGYIVRSRERDEKGRLRGADYVIYEQPQPREPEAATSGGQPPILDLPTLENPTLDNPTLEKPTQEKPTLENPTQLNKDIQKTDLPKKEKINTDLSSTDSIPIHSLNPLPYDGEAATPPERKRKEATDAYSVYEEIIKDNIEYDHFVRYGQVDKDRLDEIVSIILETVCSKRKAIRIAGDDYPAELVKAKFKKYSKSIAFEDINYQLAQADDKTAIFENWCDFLNYFDASVSVQLSFINQGTQREQAEKAINIPAQDDAFNSIRTEYSDMLKNQLSKGNNGLVKHKYITFSIEADNPAAAKARLARIETDVLNNFKVLGAAARPMTGYERLNVLHGVFHPEGEPFRFDFSWLAPSGLSTKDFIAPSSFQFGEGRYFRMGRKIGAVSFLEILAPELNDRMLADILDLETGVIVNLHIRSIDQTEAIKTIKRKITDLDKMKIEEQKKAVRSGYDMDIIPSDLATFGSEAKNLLQDLQSRNERMFLLTFLVVNMADTKRKLENDIFAAAGIAQKYNCALTRLDYQQEAGLMSSIPLGENLIPIQRGLTTSSTAIFIPFITQELFQTGAALYYGLNALSNNMILCDRKQLKNPNGLILGTPGSGKSFAAKREMTNAFLITDDDIIICDPEAEYFSLVQRLNGQVIRLSPTGKGIDGKSQYVNPMDINLNYSEDDSPLALKSDFILSLCELVIGGKEGLQPIDKTVIDRAVRNVYRPFLANPDPANMPILGDLYDELLKQPEPEAARIASALELYVSGSLNVFNHRTNVELSNRLVCFDIKQLGKQLKKLGMLIVQDQVWNRVTVNRAEKKSTRYYMDEFHLLLKEEQTAAYSVEIWKRFRKWGGIPTAITQNVKDLLSSREVENIFENSDFVLMLNQAAGDRAILAKQLNISPQQMKYVTHTEAGEGLIFYGNVVLPFVDRFPKDTELYRVMTTKPEEVSKA